MTAILTAVCWLGIEAAGGGQVAAIAVATIAATAAVTLGTVWVSRAHDREVATNTNEPVQRTGSGVAESSAQSPPTIAFELRPRYPRLEFSIVNGQPVPIQITAIRVVKAASIKAEYDAVRFLTGSRIELKFNLRTAEHGEWVSAFPGQVSNLAPYEAEAFALDLSAENTINLVDIELEYINPATLRAAVVRPPEIIYVSAPYSDMDWDGSIQLIKRHEALAALLDDAPIPLNGPAAESHPDDARLVLLRGAAHLCFDDIIQGWHRISEKFARSSEFGPAAASFAEFGRNGSSLPPTVRDALENWVTDPRAVQATPAWDNESHTLIVQEFLVEGLRLHGGNGGSRISQGAAKLLSMLDSTLDLPDASDDPDNEDEGDFILSILGLSTLSLNREALLNPLIDRYGVGTIEYLIVNLLLSPFTFPTYAHLLAEALGREAERQGHISYETEEEWKKWWLENKDVARYSAMPWRPYSPRISNAATALFAAAPADVPTERDALVRLAIICNEHVIDAFATELLQAPETVNRMMLAQSDHASSEMLAVLAQDSSSAVRRHVVLNPHTDDATLRKLSHDPSEGVRRNLAESHNATPAILAILAQDSSPVVRRWVATNSRTDDATLRELSGDESGFVRNFLALNPRMPKNET